MGQNRVLTLTGIEMVKEIARWQTMASELELLSLQLPAADRAVVDEEATQLRKAVADYLAERKALVAAQASALQREQEIEFLTGAINIRRATSRWPSRCRRSPARDAAGRLLKSPLTDEEIARQVVT